MTAPENQPPNRAGEPGPDAGVDEIQADIEKTRDELGQTVSALAAKVDVKARAEEKVAETKDRITTQARAAKPAVPYAAVVAVVAALGVLWWRRRR
ncbi:DUF3618 domain-containing protein [Mycolicibacterium sp.]|uniref:DUF3618 domain-containing protein n=1 Tax=Mycolicibacterium sp. TaxID=2320850 RepID=UPI00355D558F